MSEATIYALCDPGTHEVRYIGQTVQPLQTRLRNHIAESHTGHYRKDEWLRELASAGLSPELRVLSVVHPSQAGDAEADHIRDHLARGCRLTNVRRQPSGTQTSTRSQYYEDTVPFRVSLSASTKRAIERRARQERRRPSDVARIVLEDEFGPTEEDSAP